MSADSKDTNKPTAIMHMVVPGSLVSPFDVNMAVDAGYAVVQPYTGVEVAQVSALVQDAIFSRPPGYFARTGFFLGGNDVNTALDMFDQATGAMVPPFELSVFADPNGAFTTAAAMVALIENYLGRDTPHTPEAESSLTGLTVSIFGGGPVGLCAAVLSALSLIHI